MKHILSYKLFEDHYQAEIPFGRTSKEGVIKGKPEHVQVVDAFEEFAKKTKFKGTFKSDGKPEQYLTDEVADKAINRLFGTGETDINYEDYYYDFINANTIDDNKELYSKKFFKDNDQEFNDDGFKNLDPTDINMEIFSKKGAKAFEEYRVEKAKEYLNEHGFLDALENVDEEGLKIYRAINLKVQHEYKFDDSELYDQIVKNYSGAGIYWTFDEDKPQSYSSDYKGTTYILYGKVRLQDINWVETYLKNIYNLRDECEIEVNGDAVIKIEKIFDADHRKNLPLEEPIYVES